MSLETDSLIEKPCILADTRTAATAIVCHAHRLATAQEVEKQPVSNHADWDRLTTDIHQSEGGQVSGLDGARVGAGRPWGRTLKEAPLPKRQCRSVRHSLRKAALFESD